MNDRILAVVKKVGETGVLTEIMNELPYIQKIVEGYMEVLYLRNDIVMIVNEDGRYLNDTPSFVIDTANGELPIFGNVLIVGAGGEEFVSLNDEQIDFVEKMGLVDRHKEQLVTYKLEIGERHPFMDDFSKKGISVLFDESGFMFNLILDNLTDEEVAALKTSDIRIDLVYKNGVIFFLFKISGLLDVSDIAFNINLCHEDAKKISDVEPNKGYACQIILVEGKTGVVKAMRVVSLANTMSVKLNECMKDQLNNPISKGAYTQIVDNIQRAYTSKELQKYSIAYSRFR